MKNVNPLKTLEKDTKLSRMFREIIRNPGLSASDIGRKVGGYRTIVINQVLRLEKRGFIRIVGKGTREKPGSKWEIYPIWDKLIEACIKISPPSIPYPNIKLDHSEESKKCLLIFRDEIIEIMRSKENFCEKIKNIFDLRRSDRTSYREASLLNYDLFSENSNTDDRIVNFFRIFLNTDIEGVQKEMHRLNKDKRYRLKIAKKLKSHLSDKIKDPYLKMLVFFYIVPINFLEESSSFLTRDNLTRINLMSRIDEFLDEFSDTKFEKKFKEWCRKKILEEEIKGFEENYNHLKRVVKVWNTILNELSSTKIEADNLLKADKIKPAHNLIMKAYEKIDKMDKKEKFKVLNDF